MNDASVIHFSKVLEVLGGLLLPGKNINNSFAGGGRKIAEEHILLGIVEEGEKICSQYFLQCDKYFGI